MVVAIVTAAPSFAQSQAGPALAAANATPQQRLAQLQNQLQTASDDKSLAAIGAQAAQIQAQAHQVVAARGADLAAIDQALRAPPPKGRSAAAVAQRAALASDAARRPPLQAALSQAQALETSARSTFTQVAERRREGFSARVLEQSTSPLEPAFWTDLGAAVGQDMGRLDALALEAKATALAAPEPRAGISLALGLLVALALIAPVRRVLEGLAHRALVQRGRHSRFGSTAHAVLMAVIDAGVPILAAMAVRLSASWGGLLSEGASDLSGAAVVAVGWASAILALGRALATDQDPAHRLLTVPDALSRRAAGLLTVVAVITAAGYLLSRLNYLIGASVAATIAANCVVSLAYAGAAGAILVSAGRGPKADPADAAPAETNGAPAWTLISLALGVAVVATVGAVLAGFTTLAVLISGQIFWLSVLAALGFLILRFIDDLCGVLFAPGGWADRVLAGLFRLRRSTIAQVGVLISAGLQVVVLVGTISMALTPFGDSGRLLTAHIDQLGAVIHIGSATISPIAIVSGLAVLAVGIAIAHLVSGWVARRYLPVTDWDAGVRNSVSTGVNYIGVGLALLCALAATGLGFRQIALIASALSVGIGFGLQQVVQNFVSGLILLIERPVKVGDWVNVGGVEGDIRRIRVRATEILTFDRTTVIVPNSDLITKQVQNKTLGDPRGRVELDISIGNPADAARATALILSVADGLTAILKDPKPAVYIDSLAAGGAVNFKAYLFVQTPRDATQARSALYYAVLAAFQEAGIPFLGAGGPATVIVEPGPTLQRAMDVITRLPAEDSGSPPKA
jgi:small-conductance mechanosensitive channel